MAIDTLASFMCELKPLVTVFIAIAVITFFPIVNLTLSSTILNKVQGKYLEQLKTFLYPVLQNAPPIKFVRCWRAQTDGWAASTFHNNCDGKGPTVTIIQVSSYIFGGYTDKSWSSEYYFITIAGFLHYLSLLCNNSCWRITIDQNSRNLASLFKSSMNLMKAYRSR